MADEGGEMGGGGLSGIGESIREALARRAGRTAAKMQESRGLDADVLESDDAYLVVFDAPGAAGSDVQVRFVDDTVEVRVDRFREYYEGYEMRFPGRGLSLDGDAVLPEDARVDPDAATAVLTDHGTLEVELPKVGADDEDGSVDVGGREDAEGDGAEDGDDDGTTTDDAADGDGDTDAGPEDDPLGPSGGAGAGVDDGHDEPGDDHEEPDDDHGGEASGGTDDGGTDSGEDGTDSEDGSTDSGGDSN